MNSPESNGLDAEIRQQDPTRSVNTWTPERVYARIYQANKLAVACLVLALVVYAWAAVLDWIK